MAKTGMILVTGATGQQGGAVAKELLARGHKIVVMTRHPESDKAKSLQKGGAKVVQGDLDNEESLRKALEGAWGTFAVQNTWEAGVEKEEEQGKRFARVAKEAGVQYFLYTSVGSAQRSTGIPHFDNKFRVEQTILELKFPSFTIMRPAFFMENIASPWFKPAIDQGKLTVALKPETSLQMIAVEDVGKYGLWAFENHDKLNGRAFDIAGDSATMPQTAKIISSVSGKKVVFDPSPIEAVRQSSMEFAIMLEWFDRVGYNADIEGMARESGIKPTKLAEWARKVKW
jgi:uncharacterized protein YbjT (DUF2867 family)